MDPGSSPGFISGDSTKELEGPGEEKKKRCEAKAAAKSGGDWSESESSEQDEKKSSWSVVAEVVGVKYLEVELEVVVLVKSW